MSYLADYFAIVTGYSRVQVRAIADAIEDKAEKEWVIAQDNLPEVAHEILKKRHPRPRGIDNSYGIEIGGKDQAYFYWQDMGEWWEGNTTAQALIEKKRAEKKKK